MTSTASREFGEYYGRTITEVESLEHPIEEILRELGVDITTICPNQLADKQEYTLVQAMPYSQWDEDWDYDDEDEELDEDIRNDVYTSEKLQELSIQTHKTG